MKVLIALACVAVASALPSVKPQTPDIRPAFAPQEVLNAVPDGVVASPAAPEVDAVRIEDAPPSEAEDRNVEIVLGPQTPDIRPVFVPQEVPYNVRVEDSPQTPEVDAVRVVDAPLDRAVDPVNVVDAPVYEPISRSELETLVFAHLDEAVDPVNVVDEPVYEPISRSELETLVFTLQDAPEKVVVIDHYPQIPLLPPRGMPPYYENPLWR